VKVGSFRDVFDGNESKVSSSQLVKFTTQCLALIKYYKGLIKNLNILKKQLYADVALSMALNQCKENGFEDGFYMKKI
jgi:hypothetical protein